MATNEVTKKDLITVNGHRLYIDSLPLDVLQDRLNRDRWDRSNLCCVQQKHKTVRTNNYYYVQCWAARNQHGLWYTFSIGSGKGGKVVARRSTKGYTDTEWNAAIRVESIIIVGGIKP